MIMAPGYAQPDQWQVQIQAQIALKARVLVKADGLSPDQLRAAHCRAGRRILTRRCPTR